MDHIKQYELPASSENGVSQRGIFGEGGYIPAGDGTMRFGELCPGQAMEAVCFDRECVYYIIEAEAAELCCGAAEPLALAADDAVLVREGAPHRFTGKKLRFLAFFPAASVHAAAGGEGGAERIQREDAPVIQKKGRKTWRAFGQSGALAQSEQLQGAYAVFSPQYGVMDTHCHEAEYMYVIDAKDASVRFGMSPDGLEGQHTLRRGDVLRPHEGEWHRFDFASDDGYVDFFNLFAVPAAHVQNAPESDGKATEA